MSRLISTRIPTNLITGFLGSGKTSVILHLLEQRAESERVAVLVNEFGAIGIDGNLFTGQRITNDGVAIAEVPGGCMCCSTGPLTQATLNKLIKFARPQRLLIEASGLGHSLEVLRLLSGKHYRNVISLGKSICLVDARNLSDSRYTEHSIFNQQIAIADIVVGNKDDTYQSEQRDLLVEYVQAHGKQNAEIIFTSHGVISSDMLAGDSEEFAVDDVSSVPPLAFSSRIEKPIPACGYLCETNAGEGFESTGWRFHPTKIFSREKILHFFRRIVVERAKAVVVTSDGVFGYNRSQDNLKEIELDDCFESRLEIISVKRDVNWERQILECLVAA